MKGLKTILVMILAVWTVLPCMAQEDKREIRDGNRDFRHENYGKADIDYRKALAIDSTSFAGNYNLASTFYKQENMDEAQRYLDPSKIDLESLSSADRAKFYFNLGDVSLQKKDWKAAADAFKNSLLENPGDMAAKESYIYAKEMMKNDQNGGGGEGGDNQDNQDQQDNKDQNKDQNQDQNQDNKDNKDNKQDNQDQNQDQSQDQQPQQLSQQQAQQILAAMQAKEKDTQEKVEKKKAEQASVLVKDKNW